MKKRRARGKYLKQLLSVEKTHKKLAAARAEGKRLTCECGVCSVCKNRVRHRIWSDRGAPAKDWWMPQIGEFESELASIVRKIG